MDRIYAHVQPFPARLQVIFVPGGNHWAIINSYATARSWALAMAPGINPVVAGLTVTIPASAFQVNAFDNTPVGMTQRATITWTAPAGYGGNFLMWLGTDGLTVDYQAATGASVACTGCNVKSEASPGPGSVPFDHLLVATGHIGAGTVVFDSSGLTGLWPTTLTSWRPMGIYQVPGNFGYVDNNYFSALGQTFYNDTDGPHQDETWTHNYSYFPRSSMKSSGQWDGYSYSFRNVFETKQALRWRIEGNIFDGSAAYQNAGNVFYIAGSYAPSFSTGTQDILARNNIYKHLSSGFQCAGGGAQVPPDSPTASRIELSNNLWIDLDRDLYNNGGGGLFSGFAGITPGCEDVNIHNNTMDLALGTGPAILMMGAASNGASVMGEGLSITNNILHLSQSIMDTMVSLCGQNIASHPSNPANPCSGGSTGTTYTQMLNGAFMHIGSTISPSWNFTNNVIIGALSTRNQNGQWLDIDQQTLNSIAAGFPQGNIFPTGATMAARRAAVDWNPVTFRVTPTMWNPGNIGANVDAIQSAAGIVNNIQLMPGATGVQFSYTAPDSRACSADISPDGVSWTRMTDMGGSTTRNLLFAGLKPQTSYQYRLMCYFDQSAAYEFQLGQITSGTFTTAAVVPRVAQLAFKMPAGAASAQITLVAPGGMPITQTCNQSPCTITVNAGTYTRTIRFQSSAGAPVGPPDVADLALN